MIMHCAADGSPLLFCCAAGDFSRQWGMRDERKYGKCMSDFTKREKSLRTITTTATMGDAAPISS